MRIASSSPWRDASRSQSQSGRSARTAAGNVSLFAARTCASTASIFAAQQAVQRAPGETANAHERGDGQMPRRRRAGRCLERPAPAKNGVGGLGDEGAVLLAEVAMCAEVARHRGVCRAAAREQLGEQRLRPRELRAIDHGDTLMRVAT
jgi:hypothetical protein